MSDSGTVHSGQTCSCIWTHLYVPTTMETKKCHHFVAHEQNELSFPSFSLSLTLLVRIRQFISLRWHQIEKIASVCHFHPIIVLQASILGPVRYWPGLLSVLTLWIRTEITVDGTLVATC